MTIHHKEGCLFYVQSDHLSGEELGWAVEALYNAGACNVQVIPTVTKKGRAAHIIMIDMRPEQKDKVADALILDLRVTGWHVIQTEHCYLTVDYIKRKVHFYYGEKKFDLEVEAKKAYGLEVSIRPEYRSCEILKKKLEEYGKKISIQTCDQILQQIMINELDCYHLKQ